MSLKIKIEKRLKLARQSYVRFHRHFLKSIRLGADSLSVVAVVASLVCLVCLVILAGYDHSQAAARTIHRIVRSCQIAFLVNIIYNLTLNLRPTLRETRLLKWLVDAGVLLTLLPLLYPHPANPWIPWLERLLYNHRFIYALLAAYSVVDLSYGVARLMGKRTNPSLILSASFLFFILVGSLTLMMPRCTVAGISYVDSLFVSTSAVCITGLTPVDVSATFTPLGLLVLALLIQIGGLGVMTFTCFFALFFSGNTSIYSQMMMKDMIYSKSFNALIPTLIYILSITLVIELVGAAAIFFCVHGTLQMSLRDELIFSGFHSLSAFCNAGFSNIEGGLSNPRLLCSNQSVYIVASVLVLAGGIGFPLLANLKSVASRKLRHAWSWLTGRPLRHRPTHIYDINTKIVLIATAIIVVSSSALFYLFEADNSLAGMTTYEKVVQSVFNSFVPRSCGFSSVNPAGFLNITIVLMLLLMWIGGASQSTAGGVKVNTVAALWLQLRALIGGRTRVTAFDRTISEASLRRANAVVALSIGSYAFFAMTMMWLEPTLPAKAVLFEAASGLFTVGSSLGITPLLSTASKGLLCAAMFLGRVGIISILVGLYGTHRDLPLRMPEDNIIIN